MTSFEPREAVPLKDRSQGTLNTLMDGKSKILGDVVTEDEFEYAEGGLKAWTVILGSFLGIFPTWGVFFSVGVIQNHIARNQLAMVPTSTVSWVFSVYNFFMLGSFVFSGMYFDQNGAQGPLIFGSVMFLGGLFGLGNCTEVWHFILCLGIFAGMGSGIASSPLIGVICHHFNRKRAIATAVAINGGSIGGVVIPLMLRSLYEKVGYAWAMRILAFVSAAFLVFSVILVKEDPSKLRKPEYLAARSGGQQPSTVQKLIQYLVGSFDYKALAEPKFLFCTLGCCLAELSTGATLTYITSYCEEVGYRERDSFYIITVLNALSIIGGYGCSLLADVLLGRFNVMILINVMLGVVNLVIWLPFGFQGRGVMYGYAVVWGLLYGSLMNLAPVCCGDITRVDQFGRRYSTMYFLVGVTFLAGIPMTGAIIGKGSLQSYNNAIIFFSALSIASGILYLLSKLFALNSLSLKSEGGRSGPVGTVRIICEKTIQRF